MINLSDIQILRARGEAEKWPYPVLFEALKGLGLDRYEVNVLTHEIRYVGGGGSVTEPPPQLFTPHAAVSRFDAAGVKAALGRNQKGETTYPQFLSEIAAAGVVFYRVDFKPRTVTYHGSDKRMKIVEPVPVPKPSSPA